MPTRPPSSFRTSSPQTSICAAPLTFSPFSPFSLPTLDCTTFLFYFNISFFHSSESFLLNIRHSNRCFQLGNNVFSVFSSFIPFALNADCISYVFVGFRSWREGLDLQSIVRKRRDPFKASDIISISPILHHLCDDAIAFEATPSPLIELRKIAKVSEKVLFRIACFLNLPNFQYFDVYYFLVL